LPIFPLILLSACSNNILENLEEGKQKYQQGDCKGALPLFDKVLKKDKKVAEAYAFRAACKEKYNKLPEALDDLNEAIHYDNTQASFFYNRGVVLSRTQNYVGAIKDFDEAIKLEPENPEFFLSKGANHAWMKEFEEAERSFDNAIKLKDNYADAFYYRGILHGKNENYEKALKDLTRAQELYTEQNDKANAEQAEQAIANIKELSE
ncbi:MAG TPA: tetratricopeptide repeat protein, partial [Vampirovibrionales bacterium]